jgi:hypothetical protein
VARLDGGAEEGRVHAPVAAVGAQRLLERRVGRAPPLVGEVARAHVGPRVRARRVVLHDEREGSERGAEAPRLHVQHAREEGGAVVARLQRERRVERRRRFCGPVGLGCRLRIGRATGDVDGRGENGVHG